MVGVGFDLLSRLSTHCFLVSYMALILDKREVHMNFKLSDWYLCENQSEIGQFSLDHSQNLLSSRF